MTFDTDILGTAVPHSRDPYPANIAPSLPLTDFLNASTLLTPLSLQATSSRYTFYTSKFSLRCMLTGFHSLLTPNQVSPEPW